MSITRAGALRGLTIVIGKVRFATALDAFKHLALGEGCSNSLSSCWFFALNDLPAVGRRHSETGVVVGSGKAGQEESPAVAGLITRNTAEAEVKLNDIARLEAHSVAIDRAFLNLRLVVFTDVAIDTCGEVLAELAIVAVNLADGIGSARALTSNREASITSRAGLAVAGLTEEACGTATHTVDVVNGVACSDLNLVLAADSAGYTVALVVPDGVVVAGALGILKGCARCGGHFVVTAGSASDTNVSLKHLSSAARGSTREDCSDVLRTNQQQ